MNNIYKEQETKQGILPYLVFLASFLLIYLEDSLLFYSPSILIAVGFIFLYFMIGKLPLGYDFFVVVILFSVSIFLSENQNYKELLRVVYIYGGISLAYYYRNISTTLLFKYLYFIFFLVFFFDLVLRIYNNAGALSLSIYSIKGGGGLFSDSNYSGLLIAVIIIELFERNRKILTPFILILLFFLVFTYSRTPFFMILFYFIAARYVMLSRFILLSLFCFLLYLAYYPDSLGIDLELIDGSLNTKFFILQSFASFTESDLKTLIFGLGRANEEVLEVFRWTGHTIFGQIVQFGFLQVCLLVFVLYKYLKIYSSNGDALFNTILFGGLFSFFPSSYIGLILLTVSAIRFSKH